MGAPQQIGRYRVVGELGQGAMGTVYLGRDEGLDREVALKVMSKGISDADDRARFLREGRAAARIQHPNIIVVFELGEHEGMPYMALERLDGVDLQQAISDGLRPDPRLLLNVILQALAGLGHAHEKGIVHRDIKPSNIFVPLGLPAKIMDFGIARLAGHSVTTTSGVVTGTPNYMSPEQFQSKELDGRTDLFSTGLILYELVTGEKAYQSNDIAALFYKIVHEDVDLKVIPEGSEWDRLRLVLTRALARNREERYPDARSMSDDLAQALRDLGGSPDLTAPADQILMVRPRPTSVAVASREPTRPAGGPVFQAAPRGRPQAATVGRPPQRRGARPRSSSRTPLVLAGVLGIGALAMLGFAGWLALGPGLQPDPGDAPAPAPTGSVPSPRPTLAPAPTPRATPSAAASPTPAPTAAPATPAPAPTLEPAPATPTPAPAPTAALTIEDRLLRADQFLQSGRYRRAYDEAKAVQREDPNNEEARVIAQDAEFAMVIQEHIKKAREALAVGDRATALREIREGGALAPNDRRLRELFEEAMKQ